MTENDKSRGGKMNRRSVLKKAGIATGVLALGTTAASGTAAAGIGDGRVLDYHLNNILPKGTVKDASPADNDGKWKGDNNPIVKGPVGNAFAFEGKDNVTVPEFEWDGGPVTVAFWNYVEENNVRKSVAFGWRAMDGPSNRMLVHAPWEDNKLYWDYGNWKDKGRIATDYSNYLGKWTHIAVVSEGAEGSGKAIYLNGTKVVSKNTSGEPSQGVAPFHIGGWGNTHHIGRIDEFRIYDRVLSGAEIQSLASMGGN